jgi:hypothetical protein
MLFKQNAQTGQNGKSTPTTATAPEKASAAKPLMASATPTAPTAPRPVATPADATDGGKRLIVGEGIQMKGRSPPATAWSWRGRSR